MKIMQIAAVAAVMAGAAVGLAVPASADLTDGTYTNTVTDSTAMKPGTTSTWVVSSCGTDCKHIETGGKRNFDLHREGNTWTEINGTITTTIDNDSLAGGMHGQSGAYNEFQLSKNG